MLLNYSHPPRSYHCHSSLLAFWPCVLFSHLYLIVVLLPTMNCRGDGRRAEARESVDLGQVSGSSIALHRARQSLVVALVVLTFFFALVIALFTRRALTPGDGRRPGRASSWAECRACRSLVVALVDRSSSIARRRVCRSLLVALFVAQVAALFARRGLTPGDGRRPGRESSSAKAAGGRPQWCGRIRRSGGCSGWEGAALGGPMVDGVEGERLCEGRRWAAAWEGVGSAQAGGAEIFRCALAAFPRESSHFPAGKQK